MIVGLDASETENNFHSKVDNARRKIQPQCHCTCYFETIKEKTIAIISVSKGTRPVYYCDYTPYFRDGTQSRPAEPEEVEKLVLEYYFIQGLRAVRFELKLIKKMIEKTLPILELPTEAWKDLIKKAGNPEHEAIVDRLSETYNQILIWNNIGIRLNREPVISIEYKSGLAEDFCLKRKGELINNDTLGRTISYVEDILLLN